MLGQYDGYRQEPGVAPDSTVETFAAVTVEIDNPRWASVPFYLRTGKALAESRHTVTVRFREAEQNLFPAQGAHPSPNTLTFELTDPESISIGFCTKTPGTGLMLADAALQFRYAGSFTAAHGLQGYERLIHDVMIEDHTLFTQATGIERLWEVSTPLLTGQTRSLPYSRGSWGPAEADRLIEAGWRLAERDAVRPWQQ